ncbi:uncharacterized protein LOC144553575 [Carex rostrata]
MKERIDLDNHQDANSLSDTSEHGRHFGHRRENGTGFAPPNARTNIVDVEDTSLDHYIPCFVKKIKGMKPFLIDIKPATTFRRTRGNMSNSYDRQYSSTKNEGTSRNFSDPYSTTPAPDFGNSSNCTSWSLDPRNKEIFAAPRQASQFPPVLNQPVHGAYPGNRATTSKMNSYSAENNHHRSENFIRSSPTGYQPTPPTRYYKNTHQPARNREVSVCGPRIGKGKGADRGEYNRKDFAVSYNRAKFFMIKSFSENDVYHSMKYSVWSSTPHGNKKLDLAYRDAQKIQEVEGSKCPIFLFFSVNSSGQFVGLAEMVGPVDFKKTMDFWMQDWWSGFFPLKWHIVKDIPNYNFREITLENNDNKVVTFSRDTQEIGLPQGLKMLCIFKEYEPEKSLLDDFEYYEEKQRRKLAQKNSSVQFSEEDLMKCVQEEMRKFTISGERGF